MIRELMHDPIFLASKSEVAAKEDLQVANDLLETLIAHKESCVGMAANMIGVRKRIIAFLDESGRAPTYTVMLNPEIIKREGICETEEDALPYLKLFAKLSNPRFSIRRSVDTEWESFDAEVAKLGLTCRYGYDMIYPNDSVSVPEYDGLSIRLLTTEDMAQVKAFKQSGGCADCHVRAIQIHFDGKGNSGMKPIGIFANGELVCLAMPTLDKIRELRKYDIGAIFTLDIASKEKVVDLMWKYAVDYCLKDNATIGNSNALEDINNPWEKNSPLGVETCERVGFVKVAKNCGYSK